jgi:DNA (cytosine-5)-methyltransferase 1
VHTPPRLSHRHDGDRPALDQFLDQVLADADGRPIVADFYCCQGGATLGYQNAGYQQVGYYVLGIDLDPQPRYCGNAFIQGDALNLLAHMALWLEAHTVLVHTSPPCQGYSDTQVLRGNDHPRLIAPTRALLQQIRVPWVIENVPGARADLIDPIVLCGAMFGLATYRDRYFEAGGGLVLPQPDHPAHDKPITKMGRPRKPGEMAHYVGNFSGVQEARNDLGAQHMNRDGLRESIPACYATWVASHLTAALQPAA